MPENTAVTDSDVTHSAGFTQVSKKKNNTDLFYFSHAGRRKRSFF